MKVRQTNRNFHISYALCSCQEETHFQYYCKGITYYCPIPECNLALNATGWPDGLEKRIKQSVRGHLYHKHGIGSRLVGITVGITAGV